MAKTAYNLRLPSEKRLRRNAIRTAARLEKQSQLQNFECEDSILGTSWLESPAFSLPETSITNSQPVLLEPITANGNSSPKTPQKRNKSKKNLFDLPTEIRQEIYTLILARLLNDHSTRDPGDNAMHLGNPNQKIEPALHVDPDLSEFAKYRRVLVSMTLVSRAFRAELMQTWAETTIFQLPTVFPTLPRTGWDENCPRSTHVICVGRRMQRVWKLLQALVRVLGPMTSQHLRHVRIRCQDAGMCDRSGVRHDNDPLLAFDAEAVSAGLERLSDVHQSLKLELNFTSEIPGRIGVGSRLTMTLQQRPETQSREQAVDWFCVEDGPIWIWFEMYGEPRWVPYDEIW